LNIGKINPLKYYVLSLSEKISALTQKVQLTAGICAAKALMQHLCERFHDMDNAHVFIPGVSIHSRHKSCVQEVLMHMCPPFFHLTAFLGYMG